MCSKIAVIGMSCRFPGARNVQQFWHNVRSGLESISRFTRDELLQSGISADLVDDSRYVPAKGFIEFADCFDASFFGISPREAELTDPQHRVLLECAWATLEAAAYDPLAYPARIGIFAGCGIPAYLFNNVLPHLSQKKGEAGGLPLLIANDKDHLTSRIAYRLNLRGPAVTVQTACSTSLVAVHLACSALLAGDCEMALAGGANVSTPLRSGYLYEAGSIVSPDGHCRSFDEAAMGTVFGDGVGLVLLKNYEAALRDRDNIHAVILGSAINNDGNRKIGYSAPSIEGEKDAIRNAANRAKSLKGSYDIDYIEAHGTATPLGDPIEVAALKSICEELLEPGQTIAIGSVKSNIGHLDAASGIAGFINAVLAIEHGEIPPTLHYSQQNREIDFGATGLYVNATLRAWEKNKDRPRRASVSSFGVGGTNAHVVIEEAPRIHGSLDSKGAVLFPLSAKTRESLERKREELLRYLGDHPDLVPSDVAYTLQIGRHAFNCRTFVVSDSLDEAIDKLRLPTFHDTNSDKDRSRQLVFLFSGDAEHCINCGRALYEQLPGFRRLIDHCSDLVSWEASISLSQILYPSAGSLDQCRVLLEEPEYAVPALFALEYSTGQLLLELGIEPDAMIGTGIGEYTAACLAGVITVEEALAILNSACKMIHAGPAIEAVAAQTDEGTAQWYLGGDIALSSVNGPKECIFVGGAGSVEALRSRLSNDGIPCRRFPRLCVPLSVPKGLTTDEYEATLQRVSFKRPARSLLSSSSGSILGLDEVVSPSYWLQRHFDTTNLYSAIARISKSDSIFLEIGPVRKHLKMAESLLLGRERCIDLLNDSSSEDLVQMCDALGRIWCTGRTINWHSLGKEGNRIPLPEYPFEKARHWVEPDSPSDQLGPSGSVHSTEAQVNPSSYLDQRAQSASEFLRWLREMTQDMLGTPIEQIHSSANLAEIGIDSLLTIRVIQIVHDQFGIDLPPSYLLDGNTTLHALAEFMSQAVPAAGPFSIKN